MPASTHGKEGAPSRVVGSDDQTLQELHQEALGPTEARLQVPDTLASRALQLRHRYCG